MRGFAEVKNVELKQAEERIAYLRQVIERNNRLYEHYRRLADMRPDVLFGGRLGRYAYADMDDTVAAALALWRQEAERAV